MPSTETESTLHVLPHFIFTRACMCMLHAVELASTPSDLMNELCLQGPVLSSPAQLRRLPPVAFVGESVLLTSGLLVAHCLLFPQHHCLFRRTLPSSEVPEAGQLPFRHFCLQGCIRLNFPEHSHLFTVPGGPGYLESSPPKSYFK